MTIYIYYNDHAPPHFHAEYAEQEALCTIGGLDILRGRLPRRAHAMVMEWASLHRAELIDDWERARRQVPLASIDPLD